MAKLIIGFTGEIASGKSTCAKYLMEKHGAKGCRFSTALRDVLNRIYIPESRDTLQALSLALRTAFGEEALSVVVAKDAERLEAPIVVIDGIRRPADIKPFKNNPNFILVYLKADLETRYERITKRGENADDIGKTLDQFKEEQNYEAEQQIRELEPLAKVVIDNNGANEALYQKLDELVANYGRGANI